MSTVSYPHLVFDETGVVRVGRSRYKVSHLAAEHYHLGWSAEELLRQHPDLRPEEVYSALTYFYDHHQELVDEMRVAGNLADSMRSPSHLSRAELVRRTRESQ